jgi:hypothetical protein
MFFAKPPTVDDLRSQDLALAHVHLDAFNSCLLCLVVAPDRRETEHFLWRGDGLRDVRIIGDVSGLVSKDLKGVRG